MPAFASAFPDDAGYRPSVSSSPSPAAPRRLSAALTACSLLLALSTGACVPTAIGAIVVGGSGMVVGAVSYDGDCDGPVCALANGGAAILGILGGILTVAGGSYLLIAERD